MVLFGVSHQLPLLREEFRLNKFTLHSDLRRRAASRLALPCPSSYYYYRLLLITPTRRRYCRTEFYTTNFRSITFYARQHICYSAYMPRQFRTSVCLSVTRVHCIKTAELIIEILSLSDRHITLVFRHQGSLRKSEGVTPNGGAKYKGVAIFDQYAAISRKR